MRNPDTAPKLRTPGVMAEDLGQQLHRVLYVLRSRQHSRPAAMARSINGTLGIPRKSRPDARAPTSVAPRTRTQTTGTGRTPPVSTP